MKCLCFNDILPGYLDRNYAFFFLTVSHNSSFLLFLFLFLKFFVYNQNPRLYGITKI